jgi:hypothetical protein
VETRTLNGGNCQITATHGKMHVIANSQGGIFKMGTNFQAKTQTKVHTRSDLWSGISLHIGRLTSSRSWNGGKVGHNYNSGKITIPHQQHASQTY